MEVREDWSESYNIWSWRDSASGVEVNQDVNGDAVGRFVIEFLEGVSCFGKCGENSKNNRIQEVLEWLGMV